MKHLLASTALVLALTLPVMAQDYKPDPAAKQGGTITVTYHDDVATLDPAIGYDWQNWSMIKSLFDGLMDYVPGTTTLRPGLAESYDVSKDGMTFTFHLRKGVKFTNGREMTADDVKYSLDRVTNPKTQSPGAGFFASIKGSDKMADGSATSLEGVKVVDPLTVEITLNRPDATFLQVMALNFSYIVPKEAVEASGADFGKHPVGTGAFKMTDWTLGQQIVFERNADYWRKGEPYLDKITFQVGQEPVVALLRLQKGEIDIPGDGIPPAKFTEVMADPAQAALVVSQASLQTGYITMNLNMPPFDKLEVREAVNMAINKERITQIINGRAKPTGQVLPPGMPGYDPTFETQLFVYNTDPNPRIAQAIQQDLAKIGIKASLQSLAQANVIQAGGEPASAPMIWSGGMAWAADFPDPSDFFGPILSCQAGAPGGWNWAHYCNKDLDAAAAKADAMTAPEQTADRMKAWSDIMAKVMADAPWVPVFNESRYTMRSPRLGGADALYADPVATPVNFDYIYVK
jgi:ABC-type transport system substrate-binding protein